MEKTYEKNQVKPTDPNFVYDKRKQFTKINNDNADDSWDENDEYVDDDF